MLEMLNSMPSSVFYLCVILGGLSMLSWAIIIQKIHYFMKISMDLQRFEAEFWSGADLVDLYQNKKAQPNASEAIFCAGYGSLLLADNAQQDLKTRLNFARDNMQLQQKKWEHGLYRQLSWLATIASVSPYIGLLGTVFGVMHTFQGLISAASASQASLAAVAPGISEALAMTAVGLFVAIPATIGFNRLSMWLEHLNEKFSLFQEEFILLVHKQSVSNA